MKSYLLSSASVTISAFTLFTIIDFSFFSTASLTAAASSSDEFSRLASEVTIAYTLRSVVGLKPVISYLSLSTFKVKPSIPHFGFLVSNVILSLYASDKLPALSFTYTLTSLITPSLALRSSAFAITANLSPLFSTAKVFTVSLSFLSTKLPRSVSSIPDISSEASTSSTI